MRRLSHYPDLEADRYMILGISSSFHRLMGHYKLNIDDDGLLSIPTGPRRIIRTLCGVRIKGFFAVSPILLSLEVTGMDATHKLGLQKQIENRGIDPKLLLDKSIKRKIDNYGRMFG